MPSFGQGHPLYEFNKFFYLDSSQPNSANYIFKFGNKGAQIILNNLDSDEPFALLYYLCFDDDYYWYYDKSKTGLAIPGSSIEDVLILAGQEMEALKYGTE